MESLLDSKNKDDMEGNKCSFESAKSSEDNFNCMCEFICEKAAGFSDNFHKWNNGFLENFIKLNNSTMSFLGWVLIKTQL